MICFIFFMKQRWKRKVYELLIEADIKKINEYLFNYLDMYKFFIFERHDETDYKAVFQQLKDFMKESELQKS